MATIVNRAIRFGVSLGTSSHSLTLYVYFRQKEGEGSWVQNLGLVPNLSIPLHVTSPLEGRQLSELHELIVQYLIDRGIHTVWDPRSGDLRSVLADAVSGLTFRNSGSSTRWYVLFDGQFGNVYVG